MKKLIRTSRFWFLVFCFLLLFSFVSMFFIRRQPAGDIAVLTQDGQEIERIDLSAVDSTYTITVDAPGGGWNIVEVSPGSIRVIEASCPDQVCIQHGSLPDSITPIVCLPNRLSISLEGDAPADIDGVSG